MHQLRGAARNERLRVVCLMIVHRCGERNQNRWQSHGAKFRQRQRASAADHDIGPRVSTGHVVDERINLRIDIGIRVYLFCGVEMLRSGLMADLRTLTRLAQNLRQYRVDASRALTSAEHEQSNRAISFGETLRGRRHLRNFPAHRITYPFAVRDRAIETAQHFFGEVR